MRSSVAGKAGRFDLIGLQDVFELEPFGQERPYLFDRVERRFSRPNFLGRGY